MEKLYQLQRRNLSNSIAFIRRLRLAIQKGAFTKRLISKFRINAGTPQSQKLFDADFMRRMDDICIDHQIYIQKIRRKRTVCLYSTNLRRSDKYIVRALLPKKTLCRLLICQIKLTMRFQ